MKESGNEKNINRTSDIKTDDYRLILMNDEINDFDYVIKCLVKVCKFDYEKAEQCTLLAHIKGHYPILKGDKNLLESIQASLNSKQITTIIKK